MIVSLRGGSERKTAQLETHASTGGEEFGNRHVTAPIAEDPPRSFAQRIDEDGPHFGGIEQRRIGEDLVDVSTVSLAGVFGEGAPALLVEIGEVRLVFRVDDVNAIAVSDYQVG